MILAAALLLPRLSGAERVLYATDFEDFPTGEDKLSGFQGWIGTDQGAGLHGIDDGAADGLGNTAFIGANTPDPGDNWLLFDDWSLIATGEADAEPEPVPGADFRILRMVMDANGGRQIEWPATDRVRYQVEYSTDGGTWLADLPNSLLIADGSTETLSFTDGTDTTGNHRFYRVMWLGTAP